MATDAEIATRLQVYLPRNEATFQRRARLLQGLWRAEQQLPIGAYRDQPMGTRLDDDGKRRIGYNLISDVAKQAVCTRLELRERGDHLEEDRIFANLLASTPLAFNVFASYSATPGDATSLLEHLAPNRVGSVTQLLWEHNPSRRDPTFTADSSAFDVFFSYQRKSDGKRGFIGIEVKYHESLMADQADERPRYREIAEQMGCFRDPHAAALTRPPLGQLWRNHLLAGALLSRGDYAEGLFVMLYPARNTACRRAVAEYRNLLTSESTFAAWTLEEVVAIAELLHPFDSLRKFRTRYLDFDRLRH